MPDRRGFLKLVAGLGGVLTTLLGAVPTLVAFASPAFRRKRAEPWIKLGNVGRFQPDLPVQVEFSQTVTDAWVESRALRSVWVYTADGTSFTVYNPRCTHLGCSYAWVKDKGVFQCPCHFGQFDPKTGAVVSGPPPRPLDRLEAKVEDGILYTIYGES
jgi:menaquinol-cytochrome c reductase iron-sulfur subunit